MKGKELVNNSLANSCFGRNIAVNFWFSVVWQHETQEITNVFNKGRGY